MRGYRAGLQRDLTQTDGSHAIPLGLRTWKTVEHGGTRLQDKRERPATEARSAGFAQVHHREEGGCLPQLMEVFS
jgi:hypothetical protein